MTEKNYVVTADIMNRDEDGLNPQDGSQLYKLYQTRKTWTFPATESIGTIMERIDNNIAMNEYVISVTVTEDRVSHYRKRATD